MALDVIPAVWDFIVAHPFITLAIVAALAFDFVNGFHDSANAIATVVATKVLTPLQAVSMAGFFNFVGPFVFGTAVASTIGSGIIQTADISQAYLTSIVFAALAGAIIWDLVTWYVGLPTSSSHALVGGLVGGALAAVGPGGIVLPSWPEALAIGEFALLGIVAGLGVGVVALGWSRLKLPRAGLGLLAALGALGMGAVTYGELRDVFATEGLARSLLDDALNFVIMLFLGALGGAVAWAATQRAMPPRLIPGFGGLGAGVALAVATLMKELTLGGITKTILFMVVSPFLGFFAGFLLSTVVAWTARRWHPSTVSSSSKKAQLFSSAFYALTHGTNDAQKTMGIIAVLLVAAGTLELAPGSKTFEFIPTWVIVASAAAMGIGTLFGGWRIVQTMASRITHLTPAQGFAAETGGGVVLVAMAHAGIPVSTTHAISSSIMGVGATKRASAVRWGVGRRIVGAWILTIPASAIVAYASYWAVTPELLAWYREHMLLTATAAGFVALAALVVYVLMRPKRVAAQAGLRAAEAVGDEQ